MSCVFVKRKDVIADHHAECQRQSSLVRRFEPFSVETHVVKPPRIRLVKPFRNRLIVLFVSRNVGVIENQFEVFFRELLQSVLDQRGGFCK